MRSITTLAAVAAMTLAINASRAEEAAPLTNRSTIGFVLTWWGHIVVPSSPADNPCPDGFGHSGFENFRAEFPTEAQQQAEFQRCGSFNHRGPNCENVWYNPTVVEDKLPFKEAKTKVAYGWNLDGTKNGEATPQTCAHEKFTSSDGDVGVDNQLYRALACQPGLRPGNLNDTFLKSSMQSEADARFLLEISEVDDPLNDDSVEVTVYQGIDPLRKGPAGEFLPFTSQRIKPNAPQYRTHGKIKDGVLTTEPMSMTIPMFAWGSYIPGEFSIKDAQFRIKLADAGAEGLVAGYNDLDKFWAGYAKAIDAMDPESGASAPSVYRAVHRLADGYKDAKTGQCTAISATYTARFTRALIIHPQGAQQTAEAPHNGTLLSKAETGGAAR